MQIYLPIAETSLNIFVLLGAGGLIGVLSGVFGIGGGFLMTPLLIFMGVPSTIAVGTQSAQLVALSVSGVVTHIRHNTIDFRMGFVFIIGSSIGLIVGSRIFVWLTEIGQIEFFIKLSYVFLLGTIGSLMAIEALYTVISSRTKKNSEIAQKQVKRKRLHLWMQSLPFPINFEKSQVYISVIPPLVISFFVGLVSVIMGVGGGFIIIPSMIYLLNMPTFLVVGTSLFQISLTMAIATILHAVNSQSVDVVLGLFLLIGSVVGVQFGSRIGRKLTSLQLRSSLGLIVLSVSIWIAINLIMTPRDIFSVESF